MRVRERAGEGEAGTVPLQEKGRPLEREEERGPRVISSERARERQLCPISMYGIHISVRRILLNEDVTKEMFDISLEVRPAQPRVSKGNVKRMNPII